MTDIVGNWVLDIDWDCDGRYDGFLHLTFSANGTWAIKGDFPHRGRWFHNQGLIIWTFNDVKDIVYTANLSGSSMSGIQGYTKSKGKKGCFGGRKVELFEKVAETDPKAKRRDPAIGK